MRMAYIATWLALFAAPTHAEWFGMIHQSDGGVVLASLDGIGDANPKFQISLGCVNNYVTPRALFALISLPATGQYAVRGGQEAEAAISMGGTEWTIPMVVDSNDSSGLMAKADVETVLEIVQTIEVAPAEMAVSIAVGPISQSFSIDTEKLGSRPTEWLDACGR